MFNLRFRIADGISIKGAHIRTSKMGRSESLDIKEIKYICEQIMRGRTDSQIKSDLAEDWGKRDIRTIRQVRRVFTTAQEVLMDTLNKSSKMAGGQMGEDILRTVDIVKHMTQGLRPVHNEKTGKITYEAWLEI